MSLERIFKALVSLGLSQTDARVYTFLALKGPKKAKGIVSNLKMSKQQIHRSLKHLQEKGIVIADAKNQDAFSALLFEKALELLIEAEKTQARTMHETKKSLLAEWKTTTENSANC